MIESQEFLGLTDVFVATLRGFENVSRASQVYYPEFFFVLHTRKCSLVLELILLAFALAMLCFNKHGFPTMTSTVERGRVWYFGLAKIHLGKLF